MMICHSFRFKDHNHHNHHSHQRLERETAMEGQGSQPMELPAKKSTRKWKDMSEGQTRMTGGSQLTQLRCQQFDPANSF
ncbi:hypothetical protein CJ030_MR3G011121 [Morella rubra]|uniref:Uncharacterized protein n=1 Tax=Morella rubra TaxID=262757 RepID=A0A6A1W2X7_9ROSI|nr:hypothetical protein CJ030_MR3G011121 [Morella rubra]